MNSTRILAASAAAALLLTLAACSSAPVAEPTTSSPASSTADASECTGVRVVVETGDLEVSDGPESSTCIDTDAPIAASDAVAEAGLILEGTEEYGDQVICRVNGVPAEDFAIPAEDGSEYFETCASMAPAFAYWSLWVQPEGGEWDYAQEGVSSLQLQPGESLGLLFTLNDEPASPTP